MILPADATPEVAQKLVVYMRKAVFVNEFIPGQAFDAKECREYVLEHFHARFEAFEDLMNYAGTAATVPFKHPPLYLLLGLDWRKVRQSEEVIALEVRTFFHELQTTFVINDPRHCMGK